MNKTNEIKQILLENKDGFSISFNDLKPYNLNKGYSVSLTNIKGQNINNLIKKVLIVGNMGFNDIKDKLFIGGWYDGQNKTQFLDLSIITNNKQEVRFLLKRFKQICCFSFKDFKTYSLKEL